MSGANYLAAAIEADAMAAMEGGCDLRDALDALDLPFAAVRALEAMGADRALLAQLAGASDLKIAQVELLPGGRFAFGGPDRRLVLAVRHYGALVDLVALSSADENEWALYRGAADFLGGELLDRAVACELREVRLFATPIDWVRGGLASSSGAIGGQEPAGVCVLDWTASALSGLRGLRETCTIVCDRGAGERLKALLAHGGLPQVGEIGTGFRRAA